jgi:hypothetical protein
MGLVPHLPSRAAGLPPLAAAALALLLVGHASCRRPNASSPSAESLGQYQVQGTLEDNACGEGHTAPPSFAFYVELSRGAGSSHGYWKLPDGPMVDGTLDREGAFRFEERVQATAIESEPDLGIPGCALERAEVVSGQIIAPTPSEEDAELSPDGGAPAERERLRGTTTVTVSPVAGGDCSALLSVFGGPFPALPCQLRYRLDGERLQTPLW